MIVCCREDEASSLLVSDLRDYKRSSYPQREKAEIRDYLRKHFIEDAGIDCQNVGCVGASVDPEKYVPTAGMHNLLLCTSKTNEFSLHMFSQFLCQDCYIHKVWNGKVTLHPPSS